MLDKKTKKSESKKIIKKCHCCGQLLESQKEQQQCLKCGKSFLPLNYFQKIHDHSGDKYKDLFASGHEINDEDIVKGLYVIW